MKPVATAAVQPSEDVGAGIRLRAICKLLDVPVPTNWTDAQTDEGRFSLLAGIRRAIEAGMATAASRDVLAERQRQINVEGWTPEHDDAHTQMKMAEAAAVYALEAAGWDTKRSYPFWPWAWEWFKPTDRRRDLVKAGALILAEIERLDRAAQRGEA